MRRGRLGPRAAGAAFLLLTSSVLLTQELSAAPRAAAGPTRGLLNGGTGTLGVGCLEPESRTRTIEPYTANRKTTVVFKLANGTTITRESVTKEARDSSGRTYRESRPEAPLGSDGPVATFSFFNVHDPVGRVTISWNSHSKEATVTHMPEPGAAAPRVTTAPPAGYAILADVTSTPPTPRAIQPQPEVEELGTKTINGLMARGMRTTRVIPVGQAGNDQPLTVIHETWISTELRLAVLQIDDDPRTGVRTTELTDIERGEPDPALFQVPEGYTVKERYPGQQD